MYKIFNGDIDKTQKGYLVMRRRQKFIFNQAIIMKMHQLNIFIDKIWKIWDNIGFSQK